MIEAISNIAKPVAEECQRYFTGSFYDLQKYKAMGNPGIGHQENKIKSEIIERQSELRHLRQRADSPVTVTALVQDNLLRISLLAGLERWSTARQALAVTKDRFFMVNSSSSVINHIMKDGLLKGYFKGALVNSLQFVAWLYPTAAFAQGGSLLDWALTGSIFAALVHPIDTLKTRWYSDISGKYSSFREVAAEAGLKPASLFAGLGPKIIHTAAFLSILHTQTNSLFSESSQLLAIAGLVASYPLLLIKSQQQVAGTRLSFATAAKAIDFNNPSRSFAGLGPFLALSLLSQYYIGSMLTPESNQAKVTPALSLIRNEVHLANGGDDNDSHI